MLVNQATQPLPEEHVQQLARHLILFRQIQDQKSAEFLTSLGGLSLQELNVLNIVGDRVTCTMTDIAKAACLSMSSVTLLIDRLVRAELVDRVRSERDRRVVTAELTASGMKIYHLQLNHMHSVISQSLSALNLTEQAHLLSLVEKIVQGWLV